MQLQRRKTRWVLDSNGQQTRDGYGKSHRMLKINSIRAESKLWHFVDAEYAALCDSRLPLTRPSHGPRHASLRLATQFVAVPRKPHPEAGCWSTPSAYRVLTTTPHLLVAAYYASIAWNSLPSLSMSSALPAFTSRPFPSTTQ